MRRQAFARSVGIVMLLAVGGAVSLGQVSGAGGRGGQGRTATPVQLKAQADAYVRFFKILQKHADVIDRVPFTGISDRRTWRAGQSPLLFDRNNQPEPALCSIADAKK